MSNALDELSWRGMLHDRTEGAGQYLASGSRTCYIGFDPTGDSLHVGHLLQVMLLVHLQRAGHHPIALVGGGTGLVGDPSGRTEERQLLTVEQAKVNADAIHRQLEAFLDFETPANPARMRNNLDWLSEVGLVDFLRDVGKYFSVNAMLRKESVRRRLDADESGISYAEFTYQLLQAYDFLQLFRQDDCGMQAGGSDQWGNITQGIDLIRRATGKPAYGLVSPLITTASGAKFGKTAAGGVWLDSERTSPFRFYQFWFNADDEDAVRYLRFFTLLAREEIEGLVEATEAAPHERPAQKALAADVTARVHGQEGLDRALQASDALFGGEIRGLRAAEIADIFSDVPSSRVASSAFSGEGQALVDLLAETGLATSKGDARRAIEGGGIYVNNRRVSETDGTVTLDEAIEGRFLVLRKGKKSYHLVMVDG